MQEICEEWDIPFRPLHIDAAAEAMAAGLSLQEAGRRKRYGFFREILKEKNAEENGKIAVAHHRDDLCETMLFQLFRGSGVSGMRGILPVSGNVIRPLLFLGKSEIEEFLRSENIRWREDESNAELVYARNRIRHEILPVAEEICEGAREHMAQSAERLRELEDFLKKEADRAEEEYLVPRADGLLIRNEAAALPAALFGELILRTLVKTAGRSRDIGLAQVDGVKELFTSQVGRKREFIYEIRAYRDYEGVVLSKNAISGSGNEGEYREESEEIVLPDRESDYPFRTEGKISAVFEIADYDGEEIPGSDCEKWFDYDIMKGGLCLRHPMDGDVITVTKEGGHKALKDYFKDEKIPFRERDKVWVLAGEHRIFWVIGHRIGEDGKIGENTEKCLKIKVKNLPKEQDIK